MAFAPPPHGMRVQELGDRLLVRFRPRRSWAEVVFLGVWLTGWTFGGVSAVLSFVGSGRGPRAFLFFWLCGWVLGECAAAVILAWKLFGRTLVTVSPEGLEVCKQVGFFRLETRYDAGLVGDVVAALVPTGEDERLRTDYRLEVAYNATTIGLGEGMGESEAQEVASLMRQKLRPQSWWTDETDTKPAAMSPHLVASSVQLSAPLRLAGWLLGTLVCSALVLGVAAIVLWPHHEAPQYALPSPSQGPTVSAGPRPPAADSFSNPRAYAAAMTRYSLTSARTAIHGQPECGEHVTWTHWACSVRGRSTTPPDAGQTHRYQCHPTSVELNNGRPTSSSLLCGPLGVTQLTSGPQLPTAEKFSSPRAYAVAMTRFSLTAGLTVVLGQPACSKRVTWSHWTCSVSGRSTTPADAGQTHRYQCHPTSVELKDGRPTTTGSVTCGPLGLTLGTSGRMPPTAETFSNPRAYATATTRYSLTAGGITTLGRPTCEERITWTHWACSATGRSKYFPYAGRILRYQCHPTSVEMHDGRPTTSNTTCGPESRN